MSSANTAALSVVACIECQRGSLGALLAVDMAMARLPRDDCTW
jgi:hypothetical protein